MKKQLLTTLLLVAFSAFAQKKPVDHSVYESWKVVNNTIISNDGRWLSYEINPQRGDGWLMLYDIANNRYDSVSRGYEARFSADSKFMAFKIKPPLDTTRAAKLAKKKDDDLPKDSLGIWVPEKNHLVKIAKIKSFRIPEKGSDWMAYSFEKAKETEDSTQKTDTLVLKKKNKKKKKKNEGNELVILKVIEGKTFRFSDVTDYAFSKNGELLTLIQQKNDSLDSTNVIVFNTRKEVEQNIFQRPGFARKPTLDDYGHQVAFVYSVDTAKVKNFNLVYWESKDKEAIVVIDSINPGLPDNYRVSENHAPLFSENGNMLFFGTAQKNISRPKDTIPEDEKVRVDVWSWNDPLIQSHQLKKLKDEETRSYLAVYYHEKKKMIQLASKDVPEVRTFSKGNTMIALGLTNIPYRQLITWDDNYYDVYTINLETGETKLELTRKNSYFNLSPGGKYLAWYEPSDSAWYVKKLLTGKTVSLTKQLSVGFYDEQNDVPQLPRSFGLAGWTENDQAILIYDKYDIWKFDPEDKEKPTIVTQGFGRQNDLTLRYEKLDPEKEYIEMPMILSAFNQKTKQSGYYKVTSKGDMPEKLIIDDYRFYGLKKAKNEDVLIWQKSSFTQYPDIWQCKSDFKNPIQITNYDKQKETFLWGTVELVKWISHDGKELEGLIYLPENIDLAKKYPMLVYFYERNSDELHRFNHISPSRSIINPAWCVSNGYVVFVPDIEYSEGFPGESADNAIVSGTLAMIAKYPFIDNENMGIQGQSWGGYQVAYLVTQTNLFKAAMAGAAVSNMTSAYGGIRWESGVSRMFQYEKSQSRIGATLWEKPLLYLANSPVFYADKIETPLLLMHNDADGAVPWTQGIELYMAMRRLQKPAWMLTYNDEEHNLTKWPNRVDLSIRMYQFFDHYLKGAPLPGWMKEGIPAIDKGKKNGYDLTK